VGTRLVGRLARCWGFDASIGSSSMCKMLHPCARRSVLATCSRHGANRRPVGIARTLPRLHDQRSARGQCDASLPVRARRLLLRFARRHLGVWAELCSRSGRDAEAFTAFVSMSGAVVGEIIARLVTGVWREKYGFPPPLISTPMSPTSAACPSVSPSSPSPRRS
jgi:hypothetical protein